MRIFKQVAVIGTGLIGGSIALAIKDKGLTGEVIGVSRQQKTLFLAKKKKIIDRGSLDISIAKDADLVILAAPVGTILKLAKRISCFIKDDCIVTDVGSTKEEVVLKLEKIFPNFIGAHPLAGSEKRGISFAQANLFKGSLCIITPTGNSKKSAFKKIKLLWEQLGAEIILLSPKRHDKILSLTSHLAHILAFSLMNTIPEADLKFSARGLKDMTRLASSSSQLWRDILLTNRKNIFKAIELFQENLSKIKSAIQKKDGRLLSRILRQAKKKRDSLN